MMTTSTAIILAAGFGSRLKADESHKLLVSLGSRPLVSHHIENFARLGVEEILIVTGFAHETLTEAVGEFPTPPGMTLSCVHNPHFESQNGISVLAGVDALYAERGPRPFWLTMSDHLFEPRLFEDLARRFEGERPSTWQGALMVDRKLEAIFDMPDATKVRLEEGDFAIGKELERFDVVDAGLFWCREGFVEALREEREERGDCSTSDAVRRLWARQQFGFWDIGPHLWQDVDTPGARKHAELLLAQRF